MVVVVVTETEHSSDTRCGGCREEMGRRDSRFIEREAGALHQLAKGIMSIPH